MTHSDLIDRWPSLAEFADDIGQSYNTAKAIRRRGWIPDWYWVAVVRSAERRGIPGVDLEVLAGIASERAPRGDALVDTLRVDAVADREAAE